MNARQSPNLIHSQGRSCRPGKRPDAVSVGSVVDLSRRGRRSEKKFKHESSILFIGAHQGDFNEM